MKQILFLIFILLLLSPILAQELIQPIQPKKQGAFSGTMAFVTKYWLWFVVVAVAGIIIIFIIMLIKRMKKKIDPFLNYYKKVIKLCKLHKDPVIKQVYLINDSGFIYMGKYLGECITNDGFLNIRLWRAKKWFLFWFPVKLDFFDLVKEDFIIRCNLNKIYKYVEKDAEGKESEKTYELTTDILLRQGDRVLIRSLGIERVQYFFYPVLRDKKGNIVDSKLEVFEREKSTALIDVLYTQAEDFANVARELININPSVRFHVKTGEPVGKKET